MKPVCGQILPASPTFHKAKMLKLVSTLFFKILRVSLLVTILNYGLKIDELDLNIDEMD